MNINDSHQKIFPTIFGQALQSVDGRRCVSEYLRYNTLSNQIGLLAIGKAACHMAQGACDVIPNLIIDGLVITRHGYAKFALPKNITVIEAGHPVPDSNSLAAGQALVEFMQRVPLHCELLILISGGASSLVEVLPEAVTLGQLQFVNQWLLGSGLPIDQMNAIRRQLSCIKGGGLANHLQGRHATLLLISDVENDDPAVIGSGLLFASTHSPALPDKIAFPKEIKNILDSVQRPVVRPCESGQLTWKTIANIDKFKKAARQVAESLGYRCNVHPDYMRGDALKVGRQLATILQSQPGVLHIWGGETTVSLPKSPGIGGRCQSLALSAVIELRRLQQTSTSTNWCVLAAGSDGKDGVSEAAGVCVSSSCYEQITNRLANAVHARDFLDRADSASFFAIENCQISTGPTGTNVNDMVLGIWENATAR